MQEFVDFIAEKEPEIQQQAPAKKKALGKVSRFLTNKFFLATVGFLAIMLFLDKNDIFTTIERKRELNGLIQSKEYYIQELAELKKIKPIWKTIRL